MNAGPPDRAWTATRLAQLGEALVACAHDHRRGRRMAAAERLGELVEELAALVTWLMQAPATPVGDARRRAAEGFTRGLEEVAEAQRQHDPLGLADRLEHELAPLVRAVSAAA